MRWREKSRQRCLGQVEVGRAEQQRQTWLSVSPFIHQHRKRGTKQLGSVCWDCPFIPLAAEVYQNTKVTCVFLLVYVNSKDGWCGRMERGGNLFLHFTEAYIIFLLPVKQNVFSTGSLVLVMAKKKMKRKKSETKKNKNSGPKRDDADSATSPPSCSC